MTRTPRRDARGRFLPKRRRNPTGAGCLEGGKFHPIRSAAAYSPARAGDLGKDKQIIAQDRAERLAYKRAHKAERGEHARRLLDVRRRRREERERGIRAVEHGIAWHRAQIAEARAYRDRAKTEEARRTWTVTIRHHEAAIRKNERLLGKGRR